MKNSEKRKAKRNFPRPKASNIFGLNGETVEKIHFNEHDEEKINIIDSTFISSQDQMDQNSIESKLMQE